MAGVRALQLTGDPATAKSVAQQIALPNGAAGDVLTISGWSKRQDALGPGGLYAVRVQVTYADATRAILSAPFAQTNHNYEFASASLTAQKPYASVRVSALYNGQTGLAVFDDLRLTIVPAPPGAPTPTASPMPTETATLTPSPTETPPPTETATETPAPTAWR
jgi:hypothetical protein